MYSLEDYDMSKDVGKHTEEVNKAEYFPNAALCVKV